MSIRWGAGADERVLIAVETSVGGCDSTLGVIRVGLGVDQTSKKPNERLQKNTSSIINPSIKSRHKRPGQAPGEAGGDPFQNNAHDGSRLWLPRRHRRKPRP